MTFVVRGTRGGVATTVVRLRADTAVAKARDLLVAGWQVFIERPDGRRNYPMTSRICFQTRGMIARFGCNKLRANLIVPFDAL